MWSQVGMGGEHHRYYKHNKFRQNPRGDPKFLVDLTRNDPHGSPACRYKTLRDFQHVCKSTESTLGGGGKT